MNKTRDGSADDYPNVRCERCGDFWLKEAASETVLMASRWNVLTVTV
jgi:hypothetical protein